MRLLAVLVALVVGVLVVLAGPTACAPAVERTEVARTTASDGALDAVVVQRSAGAGSSFGYVLSLPASGCPAPEDEVLRVVGATRSTSAFGVTVTWVGPRAVRVSWLDARFRDPDVDVLVAGTSAGPVTVLSGSGVADPAAPAGGMPPVAGPTRTC